MVNIGPAVADTLGLFAGFGIELEYMIVDDRTLDVAPLADAVLLAASGAYDDHDNGAAAWSNELVAHVIEFKTNGPAPALAGLSDLFGAQVREVNGILAPLGARLMPTGMHPWMDPDTETRLWPHGYSEIYRTYDRIFDCRGHGWSNLQSMHLNLPFRGDEEFGRLHAAIRLLLPILPALAASSPAVGGRLTGLHDNRLEFYRHNSARIPSVAGRVIPEPVFSPERYQTEILERIYADLAPFDPEGVLRFEFANSRGAIARFDRDAIEIRVLDMQECPAADLAVASLIVGALRAMVEERWASFAQQAQWSVERLEPIFLAALRHGEQASIPDGDYLRLWGAPDACPCPAADLWRHLAGVAEPVEGPVAAARDTLLAQGTLSSRITRALGDTTDRERLATVYRQLCRSLAEGTMFAA